MTQAALLSGVGTNANSGGTVNLTSGTAQASTSGTSIDFTSLPSWVKRITVMFSAVSTSGTSNAQIQLGTGSTTYTTSGYVCTSSAIASSTATTSYTSGFGFNGASASNALYGHVVLTLITGNTWVASGSFLFNTTNNGTLAGSIALGAALTAVRITTVSPGTDTFDAGSINILYE